MYNGLKIEILSNFGEQYIDPQRCYFTAAVGSTTPIIPSGTVFKNSANVYNSTYTYQYGYAGPGPWHSSGDLASVFWGSVNWPAAQAVAELVIQIRQYINRAPKSFRLSMWNADTAEWVTLQTVTDIPVWTANELRRFAVPQLITLSGNATKATGVPIDEVVALQATTHMPMARSAPDAQGDWSAAVPAGACHLLYLADGCAPICHGPYTVT